jgi:murein hydrolase activator
MVLLRGQTISLRLARLGRQAVRHVERLAARSLGPVVAALVTGTAGAAVPGAEPAPAADAAPSYQEPAKTDTRDFERLLAGLDSEEQRLGAELDALGPKLDMVRTRIVARGRAYYRLVRAGLLPVGGGFDALVDHATRVERLRAAIDRDVETRKQLEQRRTELGAELRRVRAERAPLEVQRQAMLRAETAMRQADERRDAFERAFGSSQAPPGGLAIYGAGPETGPLDADPAGSFAAMRGRLSFPLAGRAEIDRAEALGASSGGGIELRAGRDTAVRAVFAGRVVFVGEYLDYGPTVLIDHGENYFSLYGRLARAEVSLGDAVPERGRVGWVMRSGSRAPTLHFELRQGTNPVDAAKWLGL